MLHIISESCVCLVLSVEIESLHLLGPLLHNCCLQPTWHITCSTRQPLHDPHHPLLPTMHLDGDEHNHNTHSWACPSSSCSLHTFPRHPSTFSSPASIPFAVLDSFEACLLLCHVVLLCQTVCYSMNLSYFLLNVDNPQYIPTVKENTLDQMNVSTAKKREMAILTKHIKNSNLPLEFNCSHDLM